MRCILEHEKLILVAESNFEEGYLGELLHNKMQGTAKRDSMGNISKLEFFKKKQLIDMDENEQSRAIHSPGSIPVTEFGYDEAEEVEELINDHKSNIIIPREINDLGDIEINDGLDEIENVDFVKNDYDETVPEIQEFDDDLDDLDLDNLEIDFDEVDLDLK